MDDLESDGKDDCKRRSRNLSEKKRRDQFNVLINELCSIVSSTRRKLDKSSVLKATVAFLRTHNEVSARSQCCEIQEIWKPIFLCNEEFTHIMLEALDGFIMVMSSSSKLLYVSESVTTLLGYQTAEISATPFYELILEDDKHKVYYILHNPSSSHFLPSCKNQDVSPVVFTCHMKKKSVRHEEIVYELVRFQGFYLLNDKINHLANKESNGSDKIENRICFVAMGRLIHPQLLKDVSLKSGKSEFTSRHSLEWKFLFLDHRAPPIIGYLPFEVLGTSGYDYYHADDLEKICSGHEQLMLTGEGTSCPYRFLSKGQQWVWLQTHYYITYHQWTSKPEFIVSTHTVIVYPSSSNKADIDFLHEDYSHCGSSQSRKLDLFERRKGRSSSKGQKQIPSRQGCQSSLDSVYPKYVLSSPSSSVVSSQDSSGLDATSDQCVDKVPNEDMMNNESGSQYLQNEDYGINAVMSSDEIIQSSQPVPVMESRVMQDHLKQRYTEIQDQIARQQEELQQIQEQLINVQYGYTPHSAPGQLPQEQCSPMSSQIMYPSANERVSPNYGLRSMQCQVPGPDWTNNCEEFTLMDQIQVQSDAYPRM